MKLQRVKLDDLIPHPRNPRAIDERSFAGLQKSIDTFGYVEPIVWNKRTGFIVGGHQRHKALVARGETHASVVVLDLDPETELKLLVELNNRHIQGDWTEGIRELLAEIRDMDDELFEGLNFDALAGDVEKMLGTPADKIKIPNNPDTVDRSLESDHLIEIRCSAEALGRMTPVLTEWSSLDDVTIDIS